MINLFINKYEDKNPERNQELKTCLDNNLKFDISKMRVFLMTGRPTFKDYFNEINLNTYPDDINIIANSDIYFEEQDFGEALLINLKHDDCFALSRWDVNADGTATHYNNSGSQDTWIFRGAIRMVEQCNFTQGVAGCDNKIAWCLQQAGYNVTNPSKSIKTYHLHLSGVRYYDKPKKGVGIYRLPKPRVNVPIT